MKPFFFFFFFSAVAAIFMPEIRAQSAHRPVHYDAETSGIQRYNMSQVPIYRHYEDVRRYNAAPDRFGYQGYAVAPVVDLCSPCAGSVSSAQPVKLRTVVVSRQCQMVSTYDALGCRISRAMITTLYKDVYSNGGSRIWQHVAFSDDAIVDP